MAIAAKSLFNSPDLLELTALIDQVQGRWEQATAGLERAASLDPRNPELLNVLAWQYFYVRRYQDAERIQDRLIELEPNQPLFPLWKAVHAFYQKADLDRLRTAIDALPLSTKDDISITNLRIYCAMLDRDLRPPTRLSKRVRTKRLCFWEQ